MRRHFDDFERSRSGIRRFNRAMFIAVPIIMVAIVVTTGVVAYRAGCLESMILHQVCTSSPVLDDVLKDVLRR